MPDDNRFAGLSDADEETDAEPEEPADADDAEESGAGPAFEFDVTTAKSIYVRPETLELLEDAEFEVESLLRREHGIRDVTGREFHDAAVRVLAEHADEIVERILDEREQD
ncbi:hypothetical protein [Halolamina sediminis]|jgi:hypothetical protein|uniref:hypothetical protein n=1 Tax=Halolamina sediminis TaxID=1480675 RepID=UPI0006B44AC0|nr:hypothetical protein [Halolamina sediminis]